MSLKEIALSLFDPWLTNFDLAKWDEYMLPFHEFGSYIGILSLFIICWYSRKKVFWRNNLKEILLLLIFLWLATGFGGDINPGTLLKKIPMIKNAHVESRYFIIFMIFYIIVLARVIDRNITSKLLLIVILGLLTLEFIYVRNYSSFEVFKVHSEQAQYPTYITKRNITQTLEEVPKPEVYFQEDIASKLCYESIFIPTEVKHIEEERYRGEVYSTKRDTNIEILEFSPGFIHAEYEYNRLGTTELRFNTNSHYSWVVNEPHEIIENNRNLLRVSVYKGEGVVKLHYKPPYLKYVIIFYTLGVTIYLIILGRMFFKNGLKSKFKNSKTAK
ncbi:MAG: hypothetical protein DHS20C13_16540 [Thermodesulfobacteriota bacterium]|nr:MAG: hypothetical protein DHS20C13_16540 [Thermodesulfobacteriota bacterium]